MTAVAGRFIGTAPIITEEDVQAVVDVLRRGVLANGGEVEGLEADFARSCGAAHVRAVANGTLALVVAGQALGLGAGDTVLVAGYSFAATANAFLSLGCRVVAVDVAPGSMNLDAAALERAIDRHPDARAAVVVDLFGSTTDTEVAIASARRAGLLVIEDAAQAPGACSEAGETVGGGRADATTFSLYATKNITGGEGGLVATPHADVAAAIEALRNHGGRDRYHHEVLGLNLRLNEMAAALTRSQLRRLEWANRRRQENAGHLAVWCRAGWGADVAVPSEAGPEPAPTHVFHQFVVRYPSAPMRDTVARRLRNAGVDVRVFYPYTLGDLPNVSSEGLPNARAARDTSLAIPVHPGLEEADLEQLRTAILSTAMDGSPSPS